MDIILRIIHAIAIAAIVRSGNMLCGHAPSPYAGDLECGGRVTVGPFVIRAYGIDTLGRTPVTRVVRRL